MTNLTQNPVEPIAIANPLPEFGRIPDVQRLFGVKRGLLYRWIVERKVKSVCLRERGNIRGVRLVCLESVRRYIRARLEEADADVTVAE